MIVHQKVVDLFTGGWSIVENDPLIDTNLVTWAELRRKLFEMKVARNITHSEFSPDT